MGEKDADTLTLLQQIARDKGDNFWIKVLRRRSHAALPDPIAIFADAQVMHIQHPETWLPRAVGGGYLVLQTFHADDPSTSLGGFIPIHVDTDVFPPKEVDIGVVKSQSWTGPKRLEWPSAKDKEASTQPTLSIGSTFTPPAPLSGNSAANNVPGRGQPGDSIFAAEFARLEHERELLRATQRELEIERRRQEIETLRREQMYELKALEAKFTSAAANPTKQPNVAETIAAVLAAAAPIITQMFHGQNEMKLQMLRQQEQASLQNQAMVTALMARPSIDPAMEKALDRMSNMLEKSRAETVPANQMIHNMAEAMGMMTQTTMDLVHTAAEMNLGGGGKEDHPALKAIRQGVRAVTSLVEGYQQALTPKNPQPTLVPQQASMLQQVPQPPMVNAVPNQYTAVSKTPQPLAAVPTASPKQNGDVLTRLEEMIRAKQSPAAVAEQFISSLSDPVMQTALSAVDGDITELVAQRLGDWVDNSNAAYLGDVLKEVNARGIKLGIFEENSEEDGDNLDEDDDFGEEMDTA